MRALRGLGRWVLAATAVVALVVGPAVGSHPALAASPSPSGAPTAARLLLLLDASGSMAEPAGGGVSKIDAAREALGSVIDGLPDDVEAGLRVYGATVESLDQPGACEDTQLVVEPGADNRDALRAAVDAYQPFGETPIGAGLRAAGADLGTEGARSIVLVSDGIATCEPDPCIVAAELAAQGIDLRIDVVGLGVDGAARSQLRCVAAAGGGTYYDASSAEEIAESLTVATERALRPFSLDGIPIAGGPTEVSAAEIGLGVYVDEPAREGEESRWYRFERTMPGSTVLVSAYEEQPGLLANQSMDVYAEDGQRCGSGPSPAFHEVFTGYTKLVDPAAREGCDGPLLIEVSFRGKDDRVGPFGLVVAEEPPVENIETLPAPVEDSLGAAPVELSAATIPVLPGSTFGDAPLLEPGQTYSATIVPGEVNAFRVSVDWGQSLVARIDHPPLTEAERDALVSSQTPVDTQILTPLRASVYDDNSDSALPYSRTLGDSTNYVATAPVQWRNREGESTAYLAGDYTIVYQADFDSPVSVELPYTITVGLQGEPGGAPEYADGLSLLTSPAPEPSATSEASEAPEGEPVSDEGGFSWPLLLGVAVAVGAGVALAGWLWVRSRRGAGRSADT